MNGIPEVQMCEDVQSANPIIGTEKRCTKCGDIVPLNLFRKDNRNKSGIGSQCRNCLKEYGKIWYRENWGKSKKWREQNKERLYENSKKYRERHPHQARASYQKNIIARREKMRLRRQTISGRLSNRIAPAMRVALGKNKGGRKWESIVGYTLRDLKNRLESCFKDGMSWENIGEWHIDHIIPKSTFFYSSHTDAQFHQCWSLENLQPLWAKDNRIKHTRLVSIEVEKEGK